MNFKTKFPITCTGSLPLIDEKKACELIFSKFNEIPFWPQLPKKSFFENMYTQFSENLPGVVIDENKRSIYVDTKNIDEKIEKVFNEYLNANVDYFAITKKYASGFHEFIKKAKENKNKNWQFVKGHITGPVSFGLTVTDENKRALFYNKTYKELLVKFLSMKAACQIRELKKVFDKVIIFIDEPYLVSIGSSFVSINEKEVFDDLNEIVGVIHNEGASAGVHCCGNTNWGLLLKTNLDIINFDAYNFIKSIGLYPEELKLFLKNSGSLAFGLVPNQLDLAGKTNPENLADIFKSSLNELSEKGIQRNKLIETSILTPSCGLGSEEAGSIDKIFDLLFKTKELLCNL